MTRKVTEYNIELQNHYLRRGATGKLLLGIPWTPFHIAYINKKFQVIRGIGSIEEGTYAFETTEFEYFKSLKEAISAVDEYY